MTTTTSSVAANSAMSALQATKGSTASASAPPAKPYDAKAEGDKFMKLLVTQLQNQDPLNPMDNAQVTSQMAQINTVQGINTLNTTMTGMSSNLTQMQMLQGASLVGHQVLMEGNKITVDSSTGTAVGGYELAAAATSVKVDVVNAAGVTVDSFNDGVQSGGRHGFTWTPPAGTSTTGLTFKVTATSGGKAITSTPLVSDTVDAVSNSSGSLTLELRNSGSTAYNKIKSLS